MRPAGKFKPCTPADLAPILALRATDHSMLAVHPATLTWWQRRDKCRACAHHLPSLDHVHDRGGERCRALTVTIGAGGGRVRTAHQYCADAREAGADCGPGAAMFNPKESAA